MRVLLQKLTTVMLFVDLVKRLLVGRFVAVIVRVVFYPVLRKAGQALRHTAGVLKTHRNHRCIMKRRLTMIALRLMGSVVRMMTMPMIVMMRTMMAMLTGMTVMTMMAVLVVPKAKHVPNAIHKTTVMSRVVCLVVGCMRWVVLRMMLMWLLEARIMARIPVAGVVEWSNQILELGIRRDWPLILGMKLVGVVLRMANWDCVMWLSHRHHGTITIGRSSVRCATRRS
jgi:hypothetical protein